MFTPRPVQSSRLSSFFVERNENRRGQICLSVRGATADAQDEKRSRLPGDDRQQSRQRCEKSTSSLLLAEPPVFPFETRSLLFGHYGLPRCYRGKLFGFISLF